MARRFMGRKLDQAIPELSENSKGCVQLVSPRVAILLTKMV